MKYDLTCEPWIPCTDLGGNHVQLGLRDVLAKAHELSAVRDESPLATVALHRLLLAILHRVYGPPSVDAWIDLFKKARFATDPLEAYWTDHGTSFDLLHERRPFYQVRGLRELGYEPDGLGRLALERSSYGAAVNVFQHRSPDVANGERLSFASAAKGLLVLQSFAPGGLVKKKGEPGSATAAPLNRGAVILVRGASLFETLLFNLLVYVPSEGKPLAQGRAEDRPAWEQSPLARPVGDREPKRRPFGWVDLLTWQSRRLELVFDDGGVSGVIHCVGQGLDDDDVAAPEPMLAYALQGKPPQLRSVDLSDSRAAWRDIYAFARHTGADGARAPKTIEQLATRKIAAVLAQSQVRLDVLGMRGDQAAIKFLRADSLSLPRSVLDDAAKAELLRDALSLAEDAAFSLRLAVRHAVSAALSAGVRDPDKDEVSRLVEVLRAEEAFWGALAAPFHSFLDDLDRGAPAAVTTFFAILSTEARSALHRACTALGTGSRQLQGEAKAESALLVRLKQLRELAGGDP